MVFPLILVLTASLWISCEDKLDIIPKGQTTLSTLTDLETLFNQRYSLSTPFDLGLICNEQYDYESPVSLIQSQPNTLNYAYLFYDENVDRANLATSDGRYNSIYEYVNYMNVILDKIDEAEGDAVRKESVAAEAHIMRAYLHWLVVCIHAQQYDEATAATLGGVPYVTDVDVTTQKTKLTLAETYERILEDCSEEYINLLPDVAPDVLRAGKAWGYAVRAKVLMQMKRYDEALPMALKSLEYNNTLEDRSSVLVNNDWVLEWDAPNNLILMSGMISPFMVIISVETAALFEPGDYVKDYGYSFGFVEEGNELWNETAGTSYSGVEGACMFYGMDAYANAMGITVDRMYYTAAECYIRTGEIQEGLDLVNDVRRLRIHPDDYEDFTASTEEDAMALLQRAKWIECIGTYENFFDCKRWNTEEKYRRTITRTLPQGTYTLSPDSPLWVLPFPLNAVQYNSSLTQNY